jgi:DNA repair photolyase
MSIAFLDEALQRSLEPGAPSTVARLITLRAMRDAGLTPTVFVAPILPELTDSTEQINELIGTLADAGVGNILPTPLYLMRGVKTCSSPGCAASIPNCSPRRPTSTRTARARPVITATSSGHG